MFRALLSFLSSLIFKFMLPVFHRFSFLIRPKTLSIVQREPPTHELQSLFFHIVSRLYISKYRHHVQSLRYCSHFRSMHYEFLKVNLKQSIKDFPTYPITHNSYARAIPYRRSDYSLVDLCRGCAR